MAGRGSLRSPERVEALLRSLRLGSTRRAACRVADLSDDTLARWIRRDPDFADAVARAEADAEQRFVGQIAAAAGSGSWEAAAWWLERRRPESYGRQVRIDAELDVRRLAARLAATLGLDVGLIIIEAERLLREAWRDQPEGGQ